MKDIAREAGVSVATVSYIINNRKDQSIAPETVRRVNEVIDRLGYVPNLAARSLVANRSHLLGVVIPQTEPGEKLMFSNPFYGELLSSIEYESRKSGYHVLISGTNVDQSYLEVAQKRSLDGIIIVGMYPEMDLESFKKFRIPVVLVDSYCKDLPYPSINIDDFLGGKVATEYLLDRGHRRIGFVSGVLKEDGVNNERFKGYQDALASQNILFDKELVFSGTVSYEYGVQLGQSFATRRDQLPDAIFATADILAVGLIRGLKSIGVKVPEDISIVGFDDSWLASDCYPPLTTIRQDVLLKGSEAARIIIDAAECHQENTVIQTVLPVALVERSTVASIKKP